MWPAAWSGRVDSPAGRGRLHGGSKSERKIEIRAKSDLEIRAKNSCLSSAARARECAKPPLPVEWARTLRIQCGTDPDHPDPHRRDGSPAIALLARDRSESDSANRFSGLLRSALSSGSRRSRGPCRLSGRPRTACKAGSEANFCL